MSLHNKIKNLHIKQDELIFASEVSVTIGEAYVIGHRDARHAAAELAAEHEVVPEGYMLVPIEPTPAMKKAADSDTPGPMTAWKCWQVMLKAAPKPEDVGGK